VGVEVEDFQVVMQDQEVEVTDHQDHLVDKLEQQEQLTLEEEVEVLMLVVFQDLLLFLMLLVELQVDRV
jgi:hypothetical protein